MAISTSDKREQIFHNPISKIFIAIIIIILLYLSYYATLPIIRSVKTLSYQFQVDNVEGYLLNQSLKIREGKSIYTPIDDYPYSVGTYAPVFPLINSIFFFLFKPTFFFGRFINLIAYLLIAFFLGLIVYNFKKKLSPALLSITLFLSSYCVYVWAPYFRVDFLAILFGIIGIYLISKDKTNLSILFFTLSVYTKQTNLAPIIATIIFLLIKDYKTGLKFILKFGIVTLNIFILLNIITHYEFVKHTVFYNVNKFYLNDLKIWLRHYYFFYRYLIYIIALFIIYFFVRKFICRNNHSPSKNAYPLLYILYFCISQLTLLGTAKVGSAPNYLIEPVLTLSMIIGLIVSYLIYHLKDKKIIKPTDYICIIICLILLIAHTKKITSFKRVQWARTTPDSIDNLKGKNILYIISSAEGEIISEYPIFAILSGKEVLFHPFIMTQLSKQKIWDQTRFVNDLKQKRFGFIITTTNILDEKTFIDNYTPEMLEVIRRNYFIYHFEPDMAGINYFILKSNG